MPDEMIGRVGSPRTQTFDEVASTKQFGRGGGISLSSNRTMEELPLFIKNALPTLTRLKDFLCPISFGSVDTKISPSVSHRRGICRRQPSSQNTSAISGKDSVGTASLYFLKRDGSFLCGPCTLQQDVLIVHSHSDRPTMRCGLETESMRGYRSSYGDFPAPFLAAILQQCGTTQLLQKSEH